VVVGWVVFVLAVAAVAATAGTGYTTDFGEFRSESVEGFRLLEEAFGGAAGGDQGQVVVVADRPVADPATRDRIDALVRRIAAVGVDVEEPAAKLPVAPRGPNAGRLVLVTVSFPPDNTFSENQELARRVELVARDVAGLRTEFGGEVFTRFEPPQAELIGLGFAVVILIAAFGSVLAMGLPIGVAIAGIAAGVSLIGLASLVLPMPEFTSTLGIMIGLGVGIDYALFIVTRYREFIHAGWPPPDAAGRALDTAGRAVLFAGVTVVVSLLGLVVIGLSFVRGLAVGAATAVVLTLAASLTLLPALLGAIGPRLELTRRRGIIAAGLVAAALVGAGFRVPVGVLTLPLAGAVLVGARFVPWLRRPLPARVPRPRPQTVAYRWSRFVQRRPGPVAAIGLAVLVVPALPVFVLRLGFSDTGNLPRDTSPRRAYDLIAEAFGPGANGPLIVVADLGSARTAADRAPRLDSALRRVPGAAAVTEPRADPDGRVVQWTVVPAGAPQDRDTARLVRTLREEVIPAVVPAGTGEVYVTGRTAVGVDFSDYLASRFFWFLGTVLGLSFLLLTVVFRSLLVPLKAVVMNLLSLGGAYGLVVAVYQWGWGASLVGVGRAGPIEPFVPMMLFAITFGLSMDYEVFLLSRMKEEWDRTGDNAAAVADGLAATARVITAAAAIMVVIFGSFLLEDDRVIKVFGTGLAAAILLDATLVRLLLVPATMELLGARNWWFPSWLDRRLPRIQIEGRPESGPA
jgi:RND superfamily putative drug exporter